MSYNNQNVIEVSNLSFSINENRILKNISLDIKKGEFVGLIGPNGAGKSTLLKCLNGINKAEGSIKLNSEDINKISTKNIAKQTALMHQNSTVSFPFPAIDVVLMGRYPHSSRFQGESKDDYTLARKNMEFTDTLKFEASQITRLSGGEAQRVFFAKILTQETDIILLDEPTASLDISHQEQIFSYSRELCKQGKTIVSAVHDLKIAAKYCTKIILMKTGKIVSIGTPEQVFTSENISMAYGVNALVYKNSMTGLLDFFISGYSSGKKNEIVHVIGGGGSASGVIRHLFENGYKITAGVFSHGDSDLKCAEIFGIENVSTKPFTDVCDTTASINKNMILNSDITILCNMPFGTQNLGNLEAAKYAKKLIIIEDDKPELRDFTGGKALILYNQLKNEAIVTNSAKLHEVIS